MYNLCPPQPDFDRYDLLSWRIGGFGGAPMPIATIERLATNLPGLRLMNCYGATETTSPSTIMPGELTADYIDSVGLPCPGADIIVVDAEGRELPRGEIGEIRITALPSSRATGTIQGDGGKFHRRLLAFRRSRLDRRRQSGAGVRPSEGHDQPRRPENLFRRGRVGFGRP